MDQVIGGMRGIPVSSQAPSHTVLSAPPTPLMPVAAIPPSQGMLWETSYLDPDEGIRFRGFTIPDLQASPGCLAPPPLGPRS